MNNQTVKEITSGIRQLNSAERSCRTVYMVGDDPAGRRAMTALLEAANYMVRPYSRAEMLLSAVDEWTSGILILDLSLLEMPALTLQNELKTRRIGLKSIFISDSGTIETSVQAMKGGAIDFIEKPFSDEQLLNSVKAALALAVAEEKKRRQRSALEKRLNRLTRREREIMNFLIRGDSNRKLAQRLGLSSRTVEIHRSKIMRKLEVDSLPALVRMVYTSGDLEPEEVLVDISQSLQFRENQAG